MDPVNKKYFFKIISNVIIWRAFKEHMFCAF